MQVKAKMIVAKWRKCKEGQKWPKDEQTLLNKTNT